MPRAARIVFSSMPYHIISRGNNRERVFQQEEDFEKYLEICRRYKDQYEFRFYHWVLMKHLGAKLNYTLYKLGKPR